MKLPILEFPRSGNSDALRHHELTPDEQTVFAAFEHAVAPLPLGSLPSEYQQRVEEAGKAFGLTPEQSVAFFLRATLLTFEPPLATGPALAGAARMAGFHAVERLCALIDGATSLAPVLISEMPDRQCAITAFGIEPREDAVEKGREALKENTGGALRAVLVWDGPCPLPCGTSDAVLLSLKTYGPASQSLVMTIPYRQDAGGCVVEQPKFFSFAGEATPIYSELSAAFFTGVNSHPRGGGIWSGK